LDDTAAQTVWKGSGAWKTGETDPTRLTVRRAKMADMGPRMPSCHAVRPGRFAV